MKLTEREKVYHDGYEQGRFDEYAERMGYDQAEKVKAKIDKQKNCPYCRSKDPDANLEIYKDGNEYMSIGRSGDVEIDEGNLIMEENFYLYREKMFKFCPMCGRPLNEEEE